MAHSSIPLLDFNDAQQQILNTISPLQETETVALKHATERILAEAIYSPISLPLFNNSAMDGYAVRLDDLNNYHTLPIGGTIFAGECNLPKWQKGTCLRVMTGGRLPEDADGVVMQEHVSVNNNNVTFPEELKLHQNIRFKGEEYKEGQLVLEKGKRLSNRALFMLAALGISHVNVVRKPKIAIFSTGTELVEIGQPLAENQIYDSNRFALELMLNKLGCDVINLGIVVDDYHEIEKTFEQADNIADLVISSGGASVGDADFTQQILNKHYAVHLWKIAMKPGKPFAFGKLNRSWFCGLPGNPVSAIVTFYFLVQPLIEKLSGQTYIAPPEMPFKAKTRSPLKKKPGRMDFQRGFLSLNPKSELEVSTTTEQHSHFLSSFLNSQCFIILEKDRGDVEIGEYVTISYFNDILR